MLYHVECEIHRRIRERAPYKQGKMPLSLRPITVADLPAVSRLRVTAFEDMPAARVMRPGPVTPEVIAWSSERTEKYFKERSNIFVGVFDDDLAQLVAYAQWELIDAEARAEPEVEPVWPSFMNREALQEFWGSYEKVRKETMGSQDYLGKSKDSGTSRSREYRFY